MHERTVCLDITYSPPFSLSLSRLITFAPQLAALGTVAAAAVTAAAAAADVFFAGTVTVMAPVLCSCRHIRIPIGGLKVELDSCAWH